MPSGCNANHISCKWLLFNHQHVQNSSWGENAPYMPRKFLASTVLWRPNCIDPIHACKLLKTTSESTSVDKLIKRYITRKGKGKEKVMICDSPSSPNFTYCGLCFSSPLYFWGMCYSSQWFTVTGLHKKDCHSITAVNDSQRLAYIRQAARI